MSVCFIDVFWVPIVLFVFYFDFFVGLFCDFFCFAFCFCFFGFFLFCFLILSNNWLNIHHIYPIHRSFALYCSLNQFCTRKKSVLIFFCDAFISDVFFFLFNDIFSFCRLQQFTRSLYDNWICYILVPLFIYVFFLITSSESLLSLFISRLYYPCSSWWDEQWLIIRYALLLCFTFVLQFYAFMLTTST